ncbi:hypothetical protein LVJ94_18745 [Pendulispora rubella]|uniref:Uncharacterized protein n=1 Tax=Pendulispora rubella TaxID=2741070 RepID=A0ABZ2LE96_9BACT
MNTSGQESRPTTSKQPGEERPALTSQVRQRTASRDSAPPEARQSVPPAAESRQDERAPQAEPTATPLRLPYFGLAFIGGILGGAVGGGAMLLETHIATSDGAPWIRVIAILSVAFGAVLVLLTGLWLIHRALHRPAD